MSRPPRAGEPGKLIAIRAAPSERARWEASAKHAGADLSSWMRRAADELADAGPERMRGWMRTASPTPLTGHPIRGKQQENTTGSRRNPRR